MQLRHHAPRGTPYSGQEISPGFLPQGRTLSKVNRRVAKNTTVSGVQALVRRYVMFVVDGVEYEERQELHRICMLAWHEANAPF